jgi:nitroreductase/dihydropteridine reductase
LARLKIDSTPIEGLDIYLVNQEFKKELSGYQCLLLLIVCSFSPPMG